MVYTTVLHLAPADALAVATGESFPSTCTSATAECRAACLYRAGRGGTIPSVNLARLRRTRDYWTDRAAFLSTIVRGVEAHARAAARKGMTAAVRLNGTSDVVWERAHPVTRDGVEYPTIMHAFPDVQFYDYTKHGVRVVGALTGARPLPANYHLTYSFDGSAASRETARRVLSAGGTVAVVFDTHKGDALPAHWEGAPVADGDVTDVRFADPAGHVIGLRAKGPAKSSAVGGFVQSGAGALRPLPMLAA